MKIAVLALQGAFIEHEKMFEQLGVETVELRKSEDLNQPFDALVLPGGESTVQGKLLRELGMLDKIQVMILEGMPVLATCAGLILLAEQLEGAEQTHLATIPVKVKRNAYGRQLGSFSCIGEFKGIGTIPMTFIRAPYVVKAGKEVEVLATVDEKIVAVRYKNQLGLSFHPECNDDISVHRFFVEQIVKKRNDILPKL